MNIFHEIRERRILPAVGVYIGASWVVVEILDRLVERYFLSPYLTDIVFWGLYSLLPAVILITWTHGRPGKDKSSKAEKVGVPINVIASVGLLVTLFAGKDLSATADLVTVANEMGVEEAHYVPRESYRRRVAVFFWNRGVGLPESDWLQYGITDLLVQDLNQNPFLIVDSPWENREYGFYDRMKAAGFEDGLGLPLNLMRELADDANRSYFIEGDIGYTGGEYRLTARVWHSGSLEKLDEISEAGHDLLAVVDVISEGIRNALDVPQGKSGLAGDLPLVETYGGSSEAHEAYIRGMNAVLFENDFDKSNRFFETAIDADPDFVLAWLMKGSNYWEQGDVQAAQFALAEARRLDYRLPERDQVKLKMFTYRISGEQDKLENFLRLRTKVAPDASSFRALARFLMYTGRLEESKERFLQVMERDSADLASWLELAILERATGNIAAAIEYTSRFLQARPEDLEAILLLGDLLLEAGDLEGAQGQFEQAQLVDDFPVIPTLRLAMLSARNAEWAMARTLIEEARVLADSAAQLSSVLQVEGALETRLGRIQRSIELTGERSELDRLSMPPVEQVFSNNIPLIQFNILLDRPEAAEEVLDSALKVLQPPMDQFLGFSEAIIRARQGRFDEADAALQKGEEAIERFKADYLAFQIPLTAGEIANERKDFSTAARNFEQAILAANRSVIQSEFRHWMSLLYGACAEMHVKAGEFDLAQSVLDYAFKRDSAEPSLWVARAMLQKSRGSPHMALASINYALAIWADADPEYTEYRKALALRDEYLAAAAH